MKRKEYYNLKDISVISDYKLNGCGKIIKGVKIVQIFHKGKPVTKRVETKELLLPYLFNWLEEEKEVEE